MQQHHFIESPKRSLIKTLSWKVVATTISFCVTYSQSGNLDESIKISGIVLAIGVVAYYLHERAWNSVHWEKQHAEHL